MIESSWYWIDLVKIPWLMIAILTLTTNLFLVFLIICRRNLRTLSNAILCSMFICGCAYAVLCIFSSKVMIHWQILSKSRLYSYIIRSSGITFTICYNLHLCGVCIVKMISIISPLRYRILLCRKKTFIIIGIIWAIPIVLGPIPALMDFLYWLQNRPSRHYLIVRQICNTVILIITIIVPILFTIMLYIVAFIIMNRRNRLAMLAASRAHCNHQACQLSNVGRNLIIIKQMLVMLGLFTVCWLPYFIFIISIDYIQIQISLPFALLHIMDGLSYLALSYPAINPILFAYYTASIRDEIKILIAQCCKI